MVPSIFFVVDAVHIISSPPHIENALESVSTIVLIVAAILDSFRVDILTFRRPNESEQFGGITSVSSPSSLPITSQRYLTTVLGRALVQL